MKQLIGSLLLAAAFSAVLSATTIRKLDLDQLVSESELIVHGKVLDSRSYIMPERGWVMTDTRIQVLEAVKGQPGQTVVITELGGVVGDTGMAVPGTAQFRRGEEALVFLKKVGDKWRTSGLIQGKFPVVDDHGQKIAVPAVSLGDESGRIPLRKLVDKIHALQARDRGVVR
ncbi:MAG TPA: hypothetical protein VGK99_08375 [Acidobacteriota bacterium]|jgi:hypothetical protein